MVELHDKIFEPLLSHEELQMAVQKTADQINRDFAGEFVHFICVLNGAFMFTSDLLKLISLPCSVSFIKVKSYEGMSGTGQIKDILDIDFDPSGKNLIIIEDIVDTGNTVSYLIKKYQKSSPKKLKVASLIFKKEAFQGDFTVDYPGIIIPNKFIVGYGLDYDELGRNLKDIYILKST